MKKSLGKVGKAIKFSLQLVFSAGVLWWLFHKLGAKQLLEVFTHISPVVLFSGVALYLLAQVLSALRWSMISKMFRFSANVRHYTSLYFLGMFYNIFLPTGYGGDVVKALYQAYDRTPPSKILSVLTILLDRFTGLAALLFLGGIASWGLKKEFGLYGSIMAWGFVVCVICGLLLLRPFSRWRFFPRKLRFIFLTLRAHGGKFVPIGLLSVVIQLLNVFIYLLIFRSLGASISIWAVCFAYALVTMATLLPVSVGGLGVRESGWAALMVPFGAAPALGVTAGLLYFVVQTFASAFGLVPFFTLKKEASQNSSPQASN